MTQFARPVLDATIDDGVTLSSKFNGAMTALYSGHSGAAAPPSPTEHMIWTDTSAITASPSIITYRVFSSGAWFPLGTLNFTTGVYTPTGGFTSAGGNISGSINFPFGTAAAPTITFNGDTNTGIYRLSPDVIAISTAGVRRLQVSTTTMTLDTNLSLVKSNPNLSLSKNVAGESVTVQGRTGGTMRWEIMLGGAGLETGANKGSDFFIRSFDDAGNALDSNIKINRDGTGIVLQDPLYPSSGLQSISNVVGFTLGDTGGLRSLTFQPGIFIGNQIGSADLSIFTPGVINIAATGELWLTGSTVRTFNSLLIGGGSGDDSRSLTFNIPSHGDSVTVFGRHAPGVHVDAVLTVPSQAFIFRSSGVGYAPGGWQTGSDRRFKGSIVPLTGALASLGLIGGYSFERLDLPDLSGNLPRKIGVIAQEVEAALPLAVSYTGPIAAAYSTTEDEGPSRAVDPMALIALLVEAVKELNAKVEALTP